MATGTTFDYNLSRNELIDLSYQKIGIPSNSTLQTKAVKTLNLIIREEDAKGTRESKNLWALSESALILSASGFIYSSTEGLDTNILDLVSIVYRSTSGDDTPIEIIDQQQYQEITDKNATGDVEKIYLKKDIALGSQLMYVWPSPSSIGTTSEVTGSDSNNYQCIMGHTSAAGNKPITGADWRMYWVQKGSSGSAWVTATEYTNGTILHYTYKRPLFDFDLSTDNPDMPSSWTGYLVWKLAHDLSPEFDVDMESRRWLRGRYLEARADLFNSARSDTTSIHNKATYY